jgi:hypothetical protein
VRRRGVRTPIDVSRIFFSYLSIFLSSATVTFSPKGDVLGFGNECGHKNQTQLLNPPMIIYSFQRLLKTCKCTIQNFEQMNERKKLDNSVHSLYTCSVEVLRVEYSTR